MGLPAPRPVPRTVKVEIPTELFELTEPVIARATDPAVHHVRAALDLRLRTLLQHDPGTRNGEGIEDLHQMRVAVRRMRAALKAARPLLDGDWADALRAELGWLGRALGPVRDLDVLLLRLREQAAAFGTDERAAAEALVASLVAERADARAEMLTTMASPRYTALLERLADTVRLPLPTRRATDSQPELAELLTTEYRSLRRAVRKAGDEPPDERLHALRIRVKRLRYVGELAEPSVGAPAKRLLQAATTLQDVLGEHQDACVAELQVRRLLVTTGEQPSAPEVVFVAGRLVERERARAIATRARWLPAWQRLDAVATEVLA